MVLGLWFSCIDANVFLSQLVIHDFTSGYSYSNPAYFNEGGETYALLSFTLERGAIVFIQTHLSYPDG